MAPLTLLHLAHPHFTSLPLPLKPAPIPWPLGLKTTSSNPKKRAYTATKHPIPENLEPSNVREDTQHSHWHEAMAAEFDALLLVPPPKNHNIFGCKWLFHIKRNPDGSISRCKVCLVAIWFTQILGTDFLETFAPVIRPQTVKIFLTLALAHNWSMNQLDVNNAFLQGELAEEVYMEQPSGFKNDHFPHYDCKLHQAIYGLRQAPRAWHDSLETYVTSYGFVTGKSDSLLFIYSHGVTKAYFLAYVADLLITGNDNKFLQTFMHDLSIRFSLKNIGAPHYFLGIELIPTANGLFFFLSQHKFIRDLLERFEMDGAKSAPYFNCMMCHLLLMQLSIEGLLGHYSI